MRTSNQYAHRAGTALLQEFDRLDRTSSGIVAGWAKRHDALRDCRDLSDVVRVVAASPDPALAALIRENRRGCRLAGVVVIRALLPKLMRMARRDDQGLLEDYVAELWLRLAGFPLDRRPVRIAANLVLDTLKAVHSERAPAIELVDDIDRLRPHGPPERDPDPRRVLRTAEQLGLVDPRTHAVMVGVFADGLSSPIVARQHRVTPLTIRRRCTRGLRVLAAHSHQVVAAL